MNLAQKAEAYKKMSKVDQLAYDEYCQVQYEIDNDL